MTPLQTRIVAALNQLGGSATTAQIQGIVSDKSNGGIAISLTFLRGHNIVDDGSHGTVFPNGYAHTPARSPITWTLKP